MVWERAQHTHAQTHTCETPTIRLLAYDSELVGNPLLSQLMVHRGGRRGRHALRRGPRRTKMWVCRAAACCSLLTFFVKRSSRRHQATVVRLQLHTRMHTHTTHSRTRVPTTRRRPGGLCAADYFKSITGTCQLCRDGPAQRPKRVK